MDLFLLDPTCTFTGASLSNGNKMADLTTGMDLRESLDSNFATHAALKTAIQPLMAQPQAAIGSAMAPA